MKITRALLILGSWLWVLQATDVAGAEVIDRPEALQPLGSGRVQSILDSATARLDDGRIIGLIGLRPPDPPKDISPERWPPATAGRDLLADLAMTYGFTLWQDGLAINRHGHVMAHMVREDGLWLQEAVLREGLAIVDGAGATRELMPRLLEIEAVARETETGLWKDRRYQVRQADAMVDTLYQFAIVEGTIRETRKISSTVYLNFGEDWRTDFTVVLASPVRRLFKKIDTDPLALVGSRVRVRGWIQNMNGPMIELSNPQALECCLPED